ncbi:MAG: preprotein translocase subunit YajC [Acidimicrobiaceae bacterium]|nr:preprotein translocase subunit YajC [Acidimicrobiaceae bacterium]
MPVHLLSAHAGITGFVLAATAKKSSGGSSVFLILIVVMLAVYMLWLRPQRRRQQAAAQAKRQAEVGDEVVTSAGIYGRVVSFDGDRALVEIAPGTTIEVARRALGQRVDPVGDEPDSDEADASSGFGHPGYDGHDDLDGPDDSTSPSATDGPAPPGGRVEGTHGNPSGSEDDGDEKAPGGTS